MFKRATLGKMILDKCCSNAATYYKTHEFYSMSVWKSYLNAVFLTSTLHVRRNKGTKITTCKGAIQMPGSQLGTLVYPRIMFRTVQSFQFGHVIINRYPRWVADSCKDLIIRRQAALSANDGPVYNRLQSKINRQSNI